MNTRNTIDGGGGRPWTRTVKKAVPPTAGGGLNFNNLTDSLKDVRQVLGDARPTLEGARWAARDQAGNGTLPGLPPLDDGGSRNRGGGGGGGVSLADQRKWSQNQIGFLQSMLSGGRFNPRLRDYSRNTSLDQGLTSAVSADRANASGAYNALDAYLSKANARPNAYEGVQRQAGATGDAFNALLDVLGANQLEAREGRTSLSQFGRADADRSIASQELAGRTAINLREDARREGIEQQNFAATTTAQQAQNQLAQEIAAIAAQFGGDIPSLAEMGLI